METPWTSTQFQNWKSDCAKFVAASQQFEVRDILNAGHVDFYVGLCDRSGYSFTQSKQSAMCCPLAPR